VGVGGADVTFGVIRLFMVGVLFATGIVLITSVPFVATPLNTPFESVIIVVVVVSDASVVADELSWCKDNVEEFSWVSVELSEPSELGT
jgi:hypothetical protein